MVAGRPGDLYQPVECTAGVVTVTLRFPRTTRPARPVPSTSQLAGSGSDNAVISSTRPGNGSARKPTHDQAVQSDEETSDADEVERSSLRTCLFSLRRRHSAVARLQTVHVSPSPFGSPGEAFRCDGVVGRGFSRLAPRGAIDIATGAWDPLGGILMPSASVVCI